MAKTLRLVLGDQLSHSLASLEGLDRKTDWVVLAEVPAEAGYVKHHKKKIALIFSAMRHFAEELRRQRINVHYVRYDAENNAGSLFAVVKKVFAERQLTSVMLTHPGEFRVLADMNTWQAALSCPVTIKEDTRFLSSQDEFETWADDRKQLRMEYFYRQMRKSTSFLMDRDKPEGGKWNYDSSNRQSLPDDMDIPSPTRFTPDRITQEVIALVAEQFKDHFGSLDDFHYAVTREQALRVLDEFVRERLARFGDYQDAMAQGKPWLFHSHISFYLNCGLLVPGEVLARAEKAYYDGVAPLNAVEGFIRQILGWREYVRGFYWYVMPGYETQNYFDVHRALPKFFWSADTDMNCLSECIRETRDNAYAHHIQRLMVLGNFLLLAGVSPQEVSEWYLIVYADAYEWVELPNVNGMILFADGGRLASKPYASGGAYINRMSNYCKHCHYDVNVKNGIKACPFNYLYWDFLSRNQQKLSKNPRLGMPYATLSKMSDKKRREIRADSTRFFAALDAGEKV